jgi:hypothetical protein
MNWIQKSSVERQKVITLNKFLTSQKRHLLEKQTVAQQVKKFPVFYATKTNSYIHMKLQPDPNTSTHTWFALHTKLHVPITIPN